MLCFGNERSQPRGRLGVWFRVLPPPNTQYDQVTSDKKPEDLFVLHAALRVVLSYQFLYVRRVYNSKKEGGVKPPSNALFLQLFGCGSRI